MKYLITPIILATMLNIITVFNFNKKSELSNWVIVNDVVMGGQSSGKFYLDKDGKGIFKGIVSLKNSGGFASVRYNCDGLILESQTKLKIRLKGDGKNYQLRVKGNKGDYFSFVYNFKTTGEWEIIEIPLNELYPSFRGRKLNIPNFSSKSIHEIGFLIGNKKNESFKLILDNIEIW